MATPTISNQVLQPQPSQPSANIKSEWSDVSNWGKLGSRRWVEANFDKEGNLESLQLITQSNFGRLLQWAGISHNSGKKFKQLEQDPKSLELWKKAYTEIGSEHCREILNNDLLPVLKDPEQVKKAVNTLIKNHLNELPRRQQLQSITKEFSKNFNLFDTAYEERLNKFAQGKIFDFSVDLQNIESEFNDLQHKSFDQCREDFLEEIDDVIKNGIIEDAIETPPFHLRVSSLKNLNQNPENQRLLANREKFWNDFREEVKNAKSFEDLSIKKDMFLEEQLVDDMLFKALSPSYGSAGGMKAIQDIATSLLKKIDPNNINFDSPFEIEDKVSFYHHPKNFQKLTNAQKSILEDLPACLRCMKLIQSEQLHKEAELFSKNLKHFDRSKEIELNHFVNEITSDPNLSMEDIQDNFNDKRTDLFEDCRNKVVEEIVHASTPFSNIPHTNSEITTLIINREIQWVAFQQKVNAFDNFEQLDYARKNLQEEQLVDASLTETLSKNHSQGLIGCLNDMHKKVNAALYAIDPKFKDLESALKIFNKAKDVHFSEDQKKIIGQLSGYLRSMQLMQQIHQHQVSIIGKYYKHFKIKPLTDLLKADNLASQATMNPEQWKKTVEFISAVENERHNQLNEILSFDHDEVDASVINFAEHQKTLSELLSTALATPEFLYYDKLIETPSIIVPVMSLGRALDIANRLSESLEVFEGDQKLTQLSLEQLKQTVMSLEEEGRSRDDIERIQKLKAFATSIETLINTNLSIIKKHPEALINNIPENLKDQPLSILYEFFGDSLQKLNEKEAPYKSQEVLQKIDDKARSEKKSFVSAIEAQITSAQAKNKHWLSKAPKGAPLYLLKAVESTDADLIAHAEALKLLASDLDKTTQEQLHDLRKKVSQTINAGTKNIKNFIKQNPPKAEK